MSSLLGPVLTSYAKAHPQDRVTVSMHGAHSVNFGEPEGQLEVIVNTVITTGMRENTVTLIGSSEGRTDMTNVRRALSGVAREDRSKR